MEKPKQLKHKSLEKFELENKEISASLAESVEKYNKEAGLRDEDYTSKVSLAAQRELDQRALDKVVFKRNETVHDVTYPGTPNDAGYGATGDGVTDDEPAFTLAIAALSAGDTLYIPRGTYKLSDDVTVPAGNACVFESGAKVSIDTGKTFTVNGTLISDLHQIFSGAGTIDISGAEIWEISPRWFGNSVVTSFTDQDATPSVNRGRLFKTANTAATAITMFDDGIAGQRITVFINDANTTIDFSATNLHGNGGVDWAASQDDSMDCVFDGTDWWCTIGGASSNVGFAYASVDDPDELASQLFRLLHVHASRFPKGITITNCGIETDPSSTYSVDFKKYTSPSDGSPVTIETVATSSSQEATDNGTIDNPAVAAGDFVYINLPSTDIDAVSVWITSTID